MKVKIPIRIKIVYGQLKNNIFILILPSKKLFHTCFSGYYVLSITSFFVRKDCGFTNNNTGPDSITNVI